MSSLMLIISFLLHIITLFAVYQLLQHIKTLKKQDDTESLLEVMEVYLEEVRMENRRLEKMMMQEQQQNKTHALNIDKENNKDKKPVFSVTNQETAAAELDSILNESPGYDVATSLESKVLQLHNLGMSIEEIAKKLDCGKTEAELIVKLYQKQ